MNYGNRYQNVDSSLYEQKYEQFLTMTLIGPRFFNATFLTVVQNSLEVFVDTGSFSLLYSLLHLPSIAYWFVTGESVLKLKRSTDRLFGVFVLLDIWTSFKTHLKKLQEVHNTTSFLVPNDQFFVAAIHKIARNVIHNAI